MLPQTGKSHAGAIPAELLDVIMTCLAESADFASLKACSLVQKAWLPSTRPHLFASCVLTDAHSGPARCRRLSHLLTQGSSASHLQKYIRRLSLCFGKNGVMSPPSQLIQEPALPDLLTALTHVTALTITAYDKKWGKFADRLMQAFLHLFALPTFTELHLHGWNFGLNATDLALHLVPCADSLSELTLRAVEVQYHWHDPDPPGVTPVAPDQPAVLSNLKRLVISSGFRSPRVFNCPFVAPKLQHLHWACLSQDSAAFAPFLQQCAPDNLTSLSLWFHFANSSDVSQFPDVSSCMALRRLQLHISYYDTDDHHHLFINWVVDCMTRFPCLRNIESITLNFHLANEHTVESWDFTAWERLDSELRHLHARGELREVVLTLGFWDYYGPEDPFDSALVSTFVGKVARNIMQRLSKLHSTDILRTRVRPNHNF